MIDAASRLAELQARGATTKKTKRRRTRPSRRSSARRREEERRRRAAKDVAVRPRAGAGGRDLALLEGVGGGAAIPAAGD